MRNGILFSVAFHIAIVVASVIGLPHLRKPPPPTDIPIIVEVVEIGPETNVPPPPKPKVKPKAKPKPEVKTAPPKKQKPPPAPHAARTVLDHLRAWRRNVIGPPKRKARKRPSWGAAPNPEPISRVMAGLGERRLATLPMGKSLD